MEYVSTVVNDRASLYSAVRRNQFFAPRLKDGMTTIQFMKGLQAGVYWLPRCQEIRLLNCADEPGKLAIANILVDKMMNYPA